MDEIPAEKVVEKYQALLMEQTNRAVMLEVLLEQAREQIRNLEENK